MSDSAVRPIDRVSLVIVLVFIAFNVLISATLFVDPGSIDAQYLGGPLTPTRRFQWFSIASFHLFMVGVSVAALRMADPRERRWLHVANAAFYAWDALSQWLFWGEVIGMDAGTLATNASVSALVAAALALVWWREGLAPPRNAR